MTKTRVTLLARLRIPAMRMSEFWIRLRGNGCPTIPPALMQPALASCLG